MSKTLPPAWKEVPLGDVAEIQKGTAFTSKELVPGDIPVIAGGREPAYYHKYSNRPPNTITVSASGDAGYVSFHRGPIFATDCTTIRSNPEDSVTVYIYHFLRYNQNHLYRLRTGSALPHLYPRDLARFKIVIPSIKEQISIATKLDSMEETIEQTKKYIVKTEQLRDALLHELLNPESNTHTHTHTDIHLYWRETRLGDIARERNQRAGYDTSTEVFSITKHSGAVPSLEYFDRKVFSRDTKNYKVMLRDDIAYATIHLDEGSLGIMSDADKGLISPMYTVFEVDKTQVYPAFLFKLMKLPHNIDIYKRLGQGSINRRKSIKFATLKSLILAIPPLDNQRYILEKIDSFDKAIGTDKNVKIKNEQLRDSLLHRLLDLRSLPALRNGRS